MTWVSHRIAGFCMTYAGTGDLVLSSAAALCSTIPDVVEGGRNTKLLKHRGMSHNLSLWLMLFAGALLFNAAVSAQIPEHWMTVLARAVILGVPVGGLTHLLCDATTMYGIPVLPFWNFKLSFRLCRTGTVREYAIVMVLFGVATVRMVVIDGVSALTRIAGI